MPARPSSPSGQDSLRQTIAALAARLIAEEGIVDFGFAKRKAARRLGVPERDLPTNAEVEGELVAWHSLFRDEDDDERLEQMRAVAQEVMRFLAPFRPYVTGGALDGAAGAFAEVELEVYADSAKEVEIFLLGKSLDFDHREVRRRDVHDAPEAVLIFDWGGVPVRLAVFDVLAERSARRTPGGASRERMRLDSYEAFLATVAEREG